MNLAQQVTLAQRGDQQAFQAIVEQTQHMVTSISLSIVKDVASSEDVAQSVYLQCWKNLKQLRNSKSILSWLRQSTRNTALNYVRSERNIQPLEEGDADDIVYQFIEAQVTVEQALDNTQKSTIVANVIEKLPVDTREIVLLYYREQHSSSQVARLLEMSPEAVRKTLSRARQTIKQTVLDKYGQLIFSTAPTAGFTLAVVGSLSFSAPATALASTGGTFSLLKKLPFWFVNISLLIPMMVAWLTYFSSRGVVKIFPDVTKKQTFQRYRIAVSVWTLVSGIVFVLSYLWDETATWPLLTYSIFAIGLVWFVTKMQGFIYHNAPDKRRQDEGDPYVGKRSRRLSVFGLWFGLISGFGGLFAGLISQGRL